MHSGLGVTDSVDLLSGHVEVMSNLEPLEHSVLNTPLDGGLIEDWSVLEPLEHSVREEASDVRPKRV